MARSDEISTLGIDAGRYTRELVRRLVGSLPETLRDRVTVDWRGESSAEITLPFPDAAFLVQAFRDLAARSDLPPLALTAQGFSAKERAILADLEKFSRRWSSGGIGFTAKGGFRDSEIHEAAVSRPDPDRDEGMFRDSSPSTAPPPSTPFPDEAPPPPADPPRKAYGLLQCPDTVVAGGEMELTVGLSREAPAGVAGPPLERPETSVGPYTMTIQVIAEGFTPREGESLRQALCVTAEAPFPTFTLHLTADRQKAAKQEREIRASYTVDGQPLGFAVRYLTVVRKAGDAPEAPAAAAGVNVQVPSAPRAADLTAIIHRQAGSDSTLLWTFESRHPIALPDRAVAIEIGSEPQDFARRLMNEVNKIQGQDGTYRLLLGRGREIQQKMPPELWDLLRAVKTAVPGLPSVLFLSQDPYIPWELAVLEKPLFDPQAAPFLGAQAVVGRWVQPGGGQTRPRLPPPSELEVGRISLISGVYTDPSVRRLEEAEAEAGDLEKEFGADDPARVTKVNATLGEVFACLDADPGAELLHFSLHGHYDSSGLEDGLLLVDNQWLMPPQVKGSDLGGSPFVFLNACQVGQGDEVLGVYAGMAEAFLFAGASAVVAPLWSVDDKVARAIALSFYRETLRGADGAPAAEVLRRERARFTRGEQAATYLSYQFFGHPEMRLRLRE